MDKLLVNSLAETAALASKVAPRLRGGQSIGLIGDLGSGKTTFVRLLTAALGLSDEVSSPTFVLQHCYGSGDTLLLEHWDLYRVRERPEELWEPPACRVLRLVEWIDRIPALAAEAAGLVEITILSESQRRFSLHGAVRDCAGP